MHTHSRDLAADPEFDPSYRQLVDLRGVSRFDVTSPALRDQSLVTPWKSGARRAFVTDDDKAFGMLRMFESLTGGGPAEIRIFREMAEALEWLGLDANEWPS